MNPLRLRRSVPGAVNLALVVVSILGLSGMGCAERAPKPDASPEKPTTNPVASSTEASKSPKYGPEITLLRNSPDYVRHSKAPDYWALIPYYIGTPGDCACSTSLAMVVNAARSHRQLNSDDKLATTAEMAEKAQIPGINWKNRMETHVGFALDELPLAMGAAFRLYGVNKFKTEVIHVADSSKKTSAELHRDLVDNEKSDRNFIVANFNQGVYTGDADVGHIAVVGAYDAKQKRVLILDTDREWYEPYWVSEATFLKGMALVDKTTGKSRGYMKVSVLE